MKKILIVAILGMTLVFSIANSTVFAKGDDLLNNTFSTFDKDGKCKICKGTGKVKNPEYSKKRFTAKKYLKCKNCNGKGEKAEKKKEPFKIDKTKKQACPYCKKVCMPWKHMAKKRILQSSKSITIRVKCPHCGKTFSHKQYK